MISLEYIAGIFDGEGCIHINLRRIKRFSPRHSLKVTIGFFDKVGLLSELQRMFGGGTLTLIKRKGNRRDILVLIFQAKKAFEFLEIVRPYLKLKQTQAQLALLLKETYSPSHRWKCLPKELLIKREVIRRMLHQLNGGSNSSSFKELDLSLYGIKEEDVVKVRNAVEWRFKDE